MTYVLKEPKNYSVLMGETMGSKIKKRSVLN